MKLAVWMWLILLYESQVASQNPGEDCDVDTIQVQNNFHPEQYAGMWYEVDWVPLYFDDPSDVYIDYVEIYSTQATSRDLLAKTHGRVDETYESCNTHDKSLIYQAPAKYEYQAKVDNVSRSVDYWVISTDYNHYSLVYGCTQLKSAPNNSLCSVAHAWVWSRTPDLDQEYYDVINKLLPDLCLKTEDLQETVQDQDCVESSSISVHKTVNIVSLSALLAFYIIC